uniref:Transcription repressor n=1 Tax=Syphacia muris TaxID=451379 RepID=A0A0N5ARE9_9BILA
MGARFSGSMRNRQQPKTKCGCFSIFRCDHSNEVDNDVVSAVNAVDRRPTSLTVDSGEKQKLGSLKQDSDGVQLTPQSIGGCSRSIDCSTAEINYVNPTQETLLQILRCFPFPTPTTTPVSSPKPSRRFSNAHSENAVNDKNTGEEAALSCSNNMNSLKKANDTKASKDQSKKSNRKVKLKEVKCGAVEKLARVSSVFFLALVFEVASGDIQTSLN